MDKAKLTRALQIVAVAIIVALAVGLYRAKSDAAHTEAEVRRLHAEIAEREARLRELRADIATLESPANVQELAEDRLGLTLGRESAALPESAINDRLPPPRQEKARP
jgi:cell division protein FtsL